MPEHETAEPWVPLPPDDPYPSRWWDDDDEPDPDEEEDS